MFNGSVLKNTKKGSVMINNSISVDLFSNRVADYNKPTFSRDVILTAIQIKNLEDILNLYCTPLSLKQWEKINTNQTVYLETLGKLLSINVTERNFKLLLAIAEDALIGSVVSVPFYSRLVYNELKIHKLNTETSDILSNKNVESALSLATGNLEFVKTMVLPPLLSRYMTIYGIPEFGVGFDPIKIAFIQSLPV
jgi:hypothetical protein